MQQRFSVVTLVNNDTLYSTSCHTLAAQDSEQVIAFVPIYADKYGWNAATGLNHGIDKGSSEWVICVHQDVLFPTGWLARFRARLAELPSDTAVVGLVGREYRGEFAGHVIDPHGHMHWTPLPRAVVSVDEHFIAVRRDSQVRFDPRNPGFHAYGADICQTASANRLRSSVIDCPVIHLSGGKLDPSFARAADWLMEKWGKDTGYLIPLTASVIHRRTIANFLRRYAVSANLKRARDSQWTCRCADVLLAKGMLDSAFIECHPLLKGLLS